MSCLKCPAGTYSPTIAAINVNTCLNVPKGAYTDIAGSPNFNYCSQGTYQDKINQIGCSLCPNGTYNSLIGSINNTACLPSMSGYYVPFAGSPRVDRHHLSESGGDVPTQGWDRVQDVALRSHRRPVGRNQRVGQVACAKRSFFLCPGRAADAARSEKRRRLCKALRGGESRASFVPRSCLIRILA